MLEDNIEMATKMSDIKMKSIVQTYDIRDCPELKGVLEIEILLQAIPQAQKIGDNVTQQIRNKYKKEVLEDKVQMMMKGKIEMKMKEAVNEKLEDQMKKQI